MFAATLTAVVCAILQICRDYDGIGQWLSEQRLDFRHALGFWRTPPTTSGVRKLLLRIDAAALEAALTCRINNLLTDGVSATGLVPIALDGKSLRGTWHRLDHAVHLLNVIDQRTKTVLHQRLVPGDTNEHKVALEVLKDLVFTGPCGHGGRGLLSSGRVPDHRRARRAIRPAGEGQPAAVGGGHF